jgi:hypothetical protein
MRDKESSMTSFSSNIVSNSCSDAMLFSLVLDEVALAEVTFTTLPKASWFRAWEWRLVVDLSHVGCVIRKSFERVVLRVNDCISIDITAPVGTSESITPLTRPLIVVTDVMIIPEVLCKVILAFKTVQSAVFPAVNTGVSGLNGGVGDQMTL